MHGINLKKTDKGSLDLSATIDELRSKMKDLDPVSRSAALAAIFGQEAFSGWAEIVTTTDKDFNKSDLFKDDNEYDIVFNNSESLGLMMRLINIYCAKEK